MKRAGGGRELHVQKGKALLPFSEKSLLKYHTDPPLQVSFFDAMTDTPPTVPAAAATRLQQAVGRDLRELAGTVSNIAKSTAKRNSLHILHPDINSNELVQRSAPAQKAKHVSDLVRPKADAVPVATTTIPTTDATQPAAGSGHEQQSSLRLYPPEVSLAASDEELLKRAFAKGPEVPVLEGSFSTMADFVHSYTEEARKTSNQFRQQHFSGVSSVSTSADTAATALSNTPPAKKPRKQGATAQLQERRRVPTAFSGVYNAATLALYAPGPVGGVAAAAAAAAAGSSSAAQQRMNKVQKTPPGARFLHKEFTSARLAPTMYSEAVSRVVIQLALANTDRVNSPTYPEPTMVRWNYIQATAFVEAKTDEEECRFKSYCIGQDVLHPKGGFFIMRRWIPPGSKRMHVFCYACILRFVNFNIVIREALLGGGAGGGASQCFIPFRYSCETPGEYNTKAFMREASNKVSSRVRLFSLTDLKPAADTTDGRRRYEEKSTLRFFDGSKRLSAIPPINPLSYTSFEAKEMTNGRILLQWLFRDVEQRYRDILHRELPDWMKICRLAFLSFDEGLKLLEGMFGTPGSGDPVAREFYDSYMPRDLIENDEIYIYKPMDIYALAHLTPDIMEMPQMNKGYYVYFLTHIRVNAAMRLLSIDGLELMLGALIAGTPVPGGATPEELSKKRKSAPPVPVAAAAAEPDPVGGRVSRPHAVSSNPRDTLKNEFEAKKTQLETWIRAHNPLMNHILAELQKAATGDSRVDDDALLSEQVWAKVKPSDEYLGPIWPEDRRFQEVVKEPTLVYQPGPGQKILCLLKQWCTEVTIPSAQMQHRHPAAISNAIVSGLMINDKPVAWLASAPRPLSQLLKADVTYTPSFHSQSMRFDYGLLMGDLQATLWWVRSDATHEQLDGLLVAYNYFVDTWDYASRYHAKVGEMLRRGSVVWRNSYSLLVALLLRIHCATSLCQTFEAIRTDRAGKFSAYTDQYDEGKVKLFMSISEELPKDVTDYKLTEEQERIVHKRSALLDYRNSAAALDEVVYQLRRFINSHLPLAHSMVVNCTAKEGAGPLDEILFDPCVPRCTVMNDNLAARPCLYELLKPDYDQVMCEDNLPDCSPYEHQLKFISDSGVHEPVLMAQQKTAPVRCHTRDAAKQSAVMAANNTAFLKYCVQTLYCTLLGGYVRNSVYHVLISSLDTAVTITTRALTSASSSTTCYTSTQ